MAENVKSIGRRWRGVVKELGSWSKDGRVSNGDAYSADSELLWSKHSNIARYIVLGLDNAEIAKIVGMVPEYISKVRRMPAIMAQIQLLEANKNSDVMDINARINEIMPRALEYLEETLRSDAVSHSVKSQNARHLLAVGGFSPLQRMDMRKITVAISPEDLEAIRARAKAAGIEMIREESSIDD